MGKYYLISGKALANIQFRCSGKWYNAGEDFGVERISEKDFTKYRRFFQLYGDPKEIVEQSNEVVSEPKPQPKKPQKTTNAHEEKSLIDAGV